ARCSWPPPSSGSSAATTSCGSTSSPRRTRPRAASVRPAAELRDLLLVAQRLGSEWQEVGIACLGLPQSRLEQIGEERPQRAVLRTFEMLREWRRRQQGGATAARLRDCLRGAPVDPEVLELLQGM
uniref:Death domain-containing protein n=1 Tax=Anser cygnoides TaxID=8845 RepID=A0A8B9IL61_ANSCY